MNRERTVLISCDAEFCAFRRGGSLGPGALLTVARQQEESFLLQLEHEEIHSRNLELNRPSDTPHAKYIRSFVPLFEALGDRVADALRNGAFPICLTGDHSQGAALLNGVKKAFPEARLGVVWIDAHADLHSPYTTPSGNVHGMPLAMALAEDNLDRARNRPSEETLTLWSALKGKGEPVIRPEDLVYLGIRSIEAEEAYLIRQKGIKCLDVEECRQRGMQRVVTETLEHLAGCDILFVSFDVDSMDPEAVSDGTGTPVPGGFLEKESTRLLNGLLADKKVVGFEITEINPTLDTQGNAMAEASMRILRHCFHKNSAEPKMLTI